MVDDGLAADLEGENAILLAIRLLAERVDNGGVLDGGTHRVFVVARAERQIVDKNGADFVAEKVVVECDIALIPGVSRPSTG